MTQRDESRSAPHHSLCSITAVLRDALIKHTLNLLRVFSRTECGAASDVNAPLGMLANATVFHSQRFLTICAFSSSERTRLKIR